MHVFLYSEDVKVLLVQPPIEDFYDTSIRTYPLSLLYIAASLSGLCDVSVIDLRTGMKRVVGEPHPFPELRPFFRDGVYTPFSLFSRFYRFGAGRDEIRRAILDHAPDVVAISSSYTTYSPEALEVARIAKEESKETTTIMGGTHATLFPEHLLQHDFVDYVIRGEGETPFASLVTGMRTGKDPRSQGIVGVSFKDNGNLHIAGINVERNIDVLPDRRAIPSDTYRIGKKKYTFFLTSRGCPFECSFCGKPPVPYRKRSLTSVEREIDECVALGIEAIDFEDDMLNLDKGFFAGLLNLFLNRGLTLSAMNGIYPGTIDEPTMELMYAAGFRRLNFSLVDTQAWILESQHRALPTALVELLPWLEGSPFLVEVHFIIGLPEQKPEDVIETLIFLMGKRLLLGPSVFYLAPGSAAFRQVLGDVWEGQIKMMRSSAMFPASPLFPRETTYTIMKLVRFINYVKQRLDKVEGLTKLSDLLEVRPAREVQEQEILKALLMEKRFICYTHKEQRFAEEQQNRDIVRLFFERARGMRIKGFKTSNQLIVDV